MWFYGFLSCLVFSGATWVCSLMSTVNLGKLLAIITFTYFFCCILSFPSSILIMCMPFHIVPQFLDVLGCSYALISLCFNLWSFCYPVFKIWFFPWLRWVYRWVLSKPFFISATVWLPTFLFDSSLYSHCLSVQDVVCFFH